MIMQVNAKAYNSILAIPRCLNWWSSRSPRVFADYDIDIRLVQNMMPFGALVLVLPTSAFILKQQVLVSNSCHCWPWLRYCLELSWCIVGLTLVCRWQTMVD